MEVLEVLFLHIIENKNLTEIAEILDISRSSVKEYLRRASLKLDVPIFALSDFIKKILEEK